MEKLIWILESDAAFQSFYEHALGLRYQLRFFFDLISLKAAISQEVELPALLITDFKVADNSFLSLLHTTSELLPNQTAFLVVSTVDDVDAVRNCFEKGASDYLTKPVAKSELIVKVERFFECGRADEGTDGYLIDPTSLRVCRGSTTSNPLTSKEFQILTTLRQSKNQTMTRDDLVLKVWNSVRVGSKTLDVHLFHLRKKLAPLKLEIVFRPPNAYSLLESPELTPVDAPVGRPESSRERLSDSSRT